MRRGVLALLLLLLAALPALAQQQDITDMSPLFNAMATAFFRTLSQSWQLISAIFGVTTVIWLIGVIFKRLGR